MENKLLEYCLKNATAASVQKAVKAYRPINIAYDLKLFICSEFDLNKGNEFAVKASTAFEKYKVQEIKLIEVNEQLNKVRLRLKTMGKFHPKYPNTVIEHDALCVLNNELNKPITLFLKDYKKAQKQKGKKISVRQKRQPALHNPFKNKEVTT